ncbi:XRE family transcriptional regulator [Pandoraea anapnoica]|uniref:XRE family transcriptional regulator n=1 Tax=Pandoraea anapnoica TaxID=2508301 RepID=A0A5E5A5I9_9BURK|nr:helix-turn-helix transcriptional regulator [Pandoraea anapnoica]VVE68899.1 XRE family transcriptional regulator [Pandoraea anapnoica]
MFKVNRQTDVGLYKNAYMTTLSTFGRRLRYARKAAGLTQKELADKVGLKQATISELETDEYSGSAKTAAMAEVLGVTALWLAEGKGNRDGSAPMVVNYEAAIAAASESARNLIDAILRADLAGEPETTFNLILRMIPQEDEPIGRLNP